MQVLGVVGDGTGTDAVEAAVDRIVDRLSREGRVGAIRYDATIADGRSAGGALTSGGAITYDLGADGDWTATGTGMTVGDALDVLVLECEYAVVTGVRGLREPTVVLGGSSKSGDGAGGSPKSIEGDPVATARSPAELDLETIVEALEAAEPYETLSSLVDRVKRDPDANRAGAIATFTGRVRAKDDADDARTEHLEFEKYGEVADRRLAALREELESRDGVHAVAMHHRTGVVRDGEDIVFVVVLAGHRAEAFRTVEDGIDRLKDEVPLFKKEVTVEDEYWVHERD